MLGRYSSGLRLAAALALLAMTLRAMLPAGYMLTSAADGIVVSICSAHGAVNIVIDPRTGAPVQDNDHEQQSSAPSCLFAGAAPLSQPSLGAALAAPLSRGAAVEPVAPDIAPGRGLVAPPPPSTGPPALI